MYISSIRGVILEEIVIYLLEMAGYRIVKNGEEGTYSGNSGLEVQGRGERHQIDALAAFDYTPPFMYPLRLMVEAKCYASNRPVQIETIRNSVGVLKDISENYFTYNMPNNSTGEEIKVQRFNYVSAIFSTSGYTSGAEKYAIAHQIFLIQYQNVWSMLPIITALLALKTSHVRGYTRKHFTQKLRNYVRSYLAGTDHRIDGPPFTTTGSNYMRDEVLIPLQSIKGSYFGMLQGRWPMHLLSATPLPPDLFTHSDIVQCKVYGSIGSTWSFVPIGYSEGDRLWFRLSFDLPKEVAKLVEDANGDRETVAHIKTQHFSYISLSGMIGGVRRQVRLELDSNWIRQYLGREHG